jgi:phenylacetate-CoA ligase
VVCASEPLSRETRQRIVEAWGVQPFDIYGATETAGIAAECEHHTGLHLFEDLVIVEVVDDQDRPVPCSVTGAKVLVTVPFSRTLPLIRYEVSDRIALSERSCACGRSFALLDRVEGREEDLLRLPAARGGQVALHPTVLSDVLEPLPIQGWQITGMPDRIVVAIREPQGRLDLSVVAERLRGALLAHGAAALPLEVCRVEELARTALGKIPFRGRDATRPADTGPSG